MKQRKCQESGFDNLPKPREIDSHSLAYSFCAGKATWYEEMAIVFEQCRVALETGILPRQGTLEDQDEVFAEAFPAFIARWRERNYVRIWQDVNNYTESVLSSLFGKKK